MIALEEKLENIHLKICFQIKKKIILVEKKKQKTKQEPHSALKSLQWIVHFSFITLGIK